MEIIIAVSITICCVLTLIMFCLIMDKLIYIIKLLNEIIDFNMQVKNHLKLNEDEKYEDEVKKEPFTVGFIEGL